MKQILVILFLTCLSFISGCSTDHKDDKSVIPVPQEDFTNQLSMKMIKLSKGYWVSKYETTQEQFIKIMGYNPSSHFGENKLPVESVTKKEAEIFCTKLTEYEKVMGLLPEGYSYRLPSFAEWKEYLSDASLEDSITMRGKYNFRGPFESRLLKTCEVGSGEVNRLGIYDLRGNVAELSREKSKYSDAIEFGSHFPGFFSEVQQM